MGQPPTALQMSLELRTFRAGPETGHVPNNQGAAGHGRPGSHLQADPAGTAESPLELVEQVLARILQDGETSLEVHKLCWLLDIGFNPGSGLNPR